MFHRILLLLIVTWITFAVAEERVCKDLYPRHCLKWQRHGFCDEPHFKAPLQRKCRKTCNFCEMDECIDLAIDSQCEEWLNLGLCETGHVAEMCTKTCGLCDDTPKCPAVSIKNGYFISADSAVKDSSAEDSRVVMVSDVTSVGTVLQIECRDGWQLLGDNSITCKSDGTYDGQLGVCVKNDMCEVPTYGTSYSKLDRYFLVSEPMTHGVNTVSPGTYAILVCTNGRKQQSYCSSFGSWLPALKDCDDDSADWDHWYAEDNMSKRHLAGAGEFMDSE